MDRTTHQAVLLGLLRFAPNGTLFPGRNGETGRAVIADIRGALSNPPLRHLILEELDFCFATSFATAELAAGVAKAGISWAAMLAERRRMPAAVIHLDGPRASGLQREVEGDVAGRRILLLDNLVSLGGSLRQAADVATRAGAQVVGAMTIVADPGAALPFPVRSLWTQQELTDAAFDVGLVDCATHRRIKEKETGQC